jgi:hypothetical protein
MAVTALAAALAFAVVSSYRSLRTAREEAFLWLERSGVTVDTPALDREPDPARVRLRAARAALAAELDPARHQGLSPERATRESADRLAAIAQTAGEVMAERPASWDAAMIHGAATYLGWSQARDPRLFTRYRQWEAPLEAALRLAPTKREPVRFLCAAYLEIWPALSPRKRGIARGLLEEAFRDPDDLARLLDPWLDAATSLDEAFSVVPADPAAWERVEQALARRGDWRGFSAARARGGEALLALLRRDLITADRLRRQGDIHNARALYLSVARRTRPEAHHLEILEQALTRCPPGPVDRDTGERLAPHLAWALDRCLLAGCEIQPVALKRLARFARVSEPQQEALVALLSGDLPRAERIERRAGDLWSEHWAPYLIAKARALAARGRTEEIGEAEAALDQVHRSWQGHPLFWQARRDLARAAGDGPGAAQAEARLAEIGRRSWPATAWTWRRGVARLELVAAAPARGLRVALDSGTEAGAVFEVRLDGKSLGAFSVTAATAPALALAAPVRRGLHLLEIESVHGSRVLPGGVELR